MMRPSTSFALGDARARAHHLRCHLRCHSARAHAHARGHARGHAHGLSTYEHVGDLTKAHPPTPDPSLVQKNPRDDAFQTKKISCVSGLIAQASFEQTTTKPTNLNLLLGGIAVLSAVLAAAVKLTLSRRTKHASEKKKVVIIGAGFAGCQVARDLRNACHVTVVAERDFFEFAPGVPRALATGGRAADGVVQSLEEKTLRGCTVYYAETGSAYELANDRIHFQGCRRDDKAKTRTTLLFDHLVVATGARYRAPIQPDDQHITTRARSSAMTENAHKWRSKRGDDDDDAQRVVIVGAGAVGVEAAAELASAGVPVSLCDAAPEILHRLGTDAGATFARHRATSFLEKKGVRMQLGAPSNISDDEMTLWCVGATPNASSIQPAEGPEGVRLARNGDRGYLRDDHTLRALTTASADAPPMPHSRIFVLGDCAYKPPAQCLASFAHWEAEYAASAILHGGQAAYDAPPALVNLSLGRWDGVFLACDPSGSGSCRVLCWGALAAFVKCATWWWFMRWLPIPYTVASFVARLLRRVRGNAVARAAAA